jgi:hypothetical protein
VGGVRKCQQGVNNCRMLLLEVLLVHAPYTSLYVSVSTHSYSHQAAVQPVIHVRVCLLLLLLLPSHMLFAELTLLPSHSCLCCCSSCCRRLLLQLPLLRQIVAEEGSSALWRGVRPRVAFHIPAAAVCWGTYESMKTLLLGPGAPPTPEQPPACP